MTDILHGDGSAVPLLRFHEPYDSQETDTLYYANSKPSEFDEQLAPALMFGFEYRMEPFSRFVGQYDEPLLHGTASQAEARHVLVWADKQRVIKGLRENKNSYFNIKILFKLLCITQSLESLSWMYHFL